MIFRLIELAMVVGAFYLITTQLLIPGVKGTMLFPLFKKQQQLTNKLIEQNQEFVEQHLARAIEENEKVLHPVSPESIDQRMATTIAEIEVNDDVSVTNDKEIV